MGAIFIGGGSSSCLSEEQTEMILTELEKYIPFTSDVEITFECSQRNTDEMKIKALHDIGITRISSGVQTFNDIHRKRLGLHLSSLQVCDWIDIVKSYNFKDVAADIIFGLPGQTLNELLEDLHIVVSKKLTHLSVYKLAVFSDSVIYKELNSGKIPYLSEQDMLYEMHKLRDDYLLNKGFYSQTVDEYSKPDKKVVFWDLVNNGVGDNIVLGCSSLGYVNGYNYQNQTDIKKYVLSLNQGCLPIKMISKKITDEQLMERFCLVSLRRNFINKIDFENNFNEKIENHFPELIEDLLTKEFITENENNY